MMNDCMPPILTCRARARLTKEILTERLVHLLPEAMSESGLDMWLVIAQEDHLDPVFTTMVPTDSWCPILQILVFVLSEDTGQVDRINLAMTDTQGLYSKPWKGCHHEEQWIALREIILARTPKRIGINVGPVQWAASGLTHVLYERLVAALPPEYVGRLESAEVLAVRWLATLTDREIEVYDHVVRVAHALLARCFSPATLVPGVTTTEDLQWAYWQMAVDSGLPLSFKPFFHRVRSEERKAEWGPNDPIIRAGDLVHSDVGIQYLGLHSDHQQWAYVRRSGETEVPQGMRHLLSEANRFQDIFMKAFERGLTGNELLQRILSRAREEGIPGPMVYSHSLGHFLHEPGPLIGLPWEQEACPGRGDVRLEYNEAFTMELCVQDAVPEWGNQNVSFSIEEDVVFTREGCRPIHGRQTAFHLI